MLYIRQTTTEEEDKRRWCVKVQGVDAHTCMYTCMNSLIYTHTHTCIHPNHISLKKINRPRCYAKSHTAQDVFRPTPSLISYTGVIERWRLLSHVQNGVRWLALTKMHTHIHTHTHMDKQTHTHVHMERQTDLLLWSRQSLASFTTTSWAACSCPNWTCSTAYTGDRKNTPLNFWHSHNSTCKGPGLAT